MRFLHKILCKSLGVTAELAQTTKQRELSHEIKVLHKQIHATNKEHEMLVARLNHTIDELKRQLDSLNHTLDARTKRIDLLEHQNEVLQYNVKGMTSVNAHLTRWVESLRTAEEKPLTNADLTRQLAEIEGTPWEVI